jgi:radical SAM protein with 4Fe4S-binding SPASM domain
MSADKAINALKLYTSYYYAKINHQTQPWGVPMTLSVEPTTACNLRCPECPSGLRSFTRPTGSLAPTLLEKVIDENHKHLLYLIFYFQGEPYIHPSFLDMVAYAHSKKIYTITSTNGHFLNDEHARRTVESGLDRLIISVDGTTQEVYEQYRKQGKLENVIAGTRNVIKWKQKLQSTTPHIIFQCLVVKPNEHQIEEVKLLAKSLGVNEVKYKSAQLYGYEQGHPLMPEDQKYSRYKKQADQTYTLKRKIKNECWKLWHASLMTWDGQVLPCCFDKDAEHPLGNINTSTLDEIWTSQPYRNFRAKIRKGRDQIDICSNCSEGCSVWV